MALRFNQPRRTHLSRKNSVAGVPLRLVSLAVGLAFVVMLVQIAESSVTREKLAAVLGDAAPVVDIQSMDELPATLSAIDPSLLADVEDNTPFRDEEVAAWFHLLSVARKASDAELAKSSYGPIVYTQLMSQPNVYRGQVIQIVGKARRIEKLTPAENDLGLDHYYRVIIQPDRDVLRPFTLYCLQLPDGWKTGDTFPAKGLMTVQALFFKNWPHSTQEDVSLSPVFVSRTIKPLASEPRTVESKPAVPLWQVIAMALALAALVVAWVSRKKSESPRSRYPAEADDIADELNSLEVSEGRSE